MRNATAGPGGLLSFGQPLLLADAAAAIIAFRCCARKGAVAETRIRSREEDVENEDKEKRTNRYGKKEKGKKRG